jgi:type VI secretion system protein ImpK
MDNYAQKLGFDDSMFGFDSGSRDGRTTLTEVCSPVFLFLTTFRRNSQTSDMSFDELRSRVTDVLQATQRRLESDPRLRNFQEEAWYVLVATVDQAVISSQWREVQKWRMQLMESQYFKTATGGQRFFQIIEQVLTRSGDDAAELAELLFTCMALGFQGELVGDSRRFEQKRMSLYEKARLAGALGDNLTPNAYGRNDKRSPMMLPQVGLARVVLVCLVVIVVFWLVTRGLTGIRAQGTRAMINQEMGSEE